MSNMNFEKCYSIEDLRSVLGIGRNAAYKLLNGNQIKALKVSGHWRIPESSITEYINSSIQATQENNSTSH